MGRSVYSTLSMYASGSGIVCWDCREHSGSVQSLGLVTDRDQYKPDDTAHLLLQSSLPEGKYLLTLEREGIMQHKILDLKGSTNKLQIPIKDDFIPVV